MKQKCSKECEDPSCLKCSYIDHIQEISNFLTHEECDYIIQKSSEQFQDSTLGEERAVNYRMRSSSSSHFDGWEDPKIKAIYERASEMYNLRAEYIEPLQCVAYEEYQFYKPHFDASDSTKSKKGRRWGTIFVYLNDDFEGGETFFPNIDLKITPKKGKAIFFHNFNHEKKVHLYSKHAGLPVLKGKKYGLNIWLKTHSQRLKEEQPKETAIPEEHA